MKKLNLFASIIIFAITITSAFAQQITGSSVFSLNSGGARILSDQGNTASNPAIGFQSSVSTTTTAENDGGGGNGIFRPIANTMAFATGGLERMRITSGGTFGIGTTTPLSSLDVNSIPGGLQTAIIGKGKSTGVYGEANEMNIALTSEGILAGWTEAIGVFGKGAYASNVGNGNMFGVVGSATGTNPLNNVGVYGEAKSANGYNSGVIGVVNSNSGVYNSGVTGQVMLNINATWNRAVYGIAPIATNHFAGYFDGNVVVQTGTVRIGNVLTPTGYKLYVEQGILTEKVKVAVAGSLAWADYVFASDYNLKPLSEVEKFITENKHLPNVPSVTELEKEGLDLGKMQSIQMAKIEELTLYLIEMKKEINALKNENVDLKNTIKTTSK